MSQKHTDTKKLAKGVKYLAFTLPLLFLSPYILTLSFLNKDNFTFYFLVKEAPDKIWLALCLMILKIKQIMESAVDFHSQLIFTKIIILI